MYCDNCRRKYNKRVELEERSRKPEGARLGEEIVASRILYYECPECGFCYEKTEWNELKEIKCLE